MSEPIPILAATDFSAPAGIAVERAARLARERRCPLHLLHVHNDFAWAKLRALLREPSGTDPEADARERLRALADDLAVRHGLAGVETALVGGRAAAGIAARARAIGAGLVVVGAHGAGIVQEFALGGTAIKVLRASLCPVLVTRRDAARPYARVLVATDFSDASTRALRLALDDFPDAALGALHAYSAELEGRMRLAGATPEAIARYREDARAAAERNMAAFVADADTRAVGSVQTAVGFGYAATVVLEEVQRRDIDLLMVGRHGASRLDEWAMGSITLNLMHHAACDVLLVP